MDNICRSSNEQSLEIVPASVPSSLEDTNSNINRAIGADDLASLRLVRQSSSSSSSFISGGKGYLFLAVVFCMMCCTSLLTAPKMAIQSVSRVMSPAQQSSGGKGPQVNFGGMPSRKLMSAGVTTETQ